MRNTKFEMQNLNGIIQKKNYINPEIGVIEVDINDVITTSPGTETGRYDETDGNWEFSIRP